MRRLAVGLALLLLLSACMPKGSPVPDQSFAPSPTPATGQVTVQTDWSQLEAREAPVPPIGTRWYTAYTDHLILRDDYGTLIPYAGLRLMDNWPAAVGCMYGLMTEDGVAVTDPVFSSVCRPTYLGADGDAYTHPLLILAQGDPTLEEEEWNPARYAVAAPDGSWCTSFDYRAYKSGRDGLLLLEENRLSIMDPTGEIQKTYSITELGLTQDEFDSLRSDIIWNEGIGGNWSGDAICLGWTDSSATAVRILQLSTGQQATMTYTEWEDRTTAESTADAWEIQQFSGKTILNRAGESHVIPCGSVDGWAEVHGDLVVLSDPGAVYTLGGKAILAAADHRSVFWLRDALLGADGSGLLVVTTINETGNELSYYRPDGTQITPLDNWGDSMGEYWYRQVGLVGGLIEVLDWNTASYYDADTMACIFRTYLNYEGD